MAMRAATKLTPMWKISVSTKLARGISARERKQALETQQLAQDYPTVTPAELLGKEKFPLSAFLSQTSSNYLTHSPSLLFSPHKKEEK